jgi:uncharacterized protein (TIGR03382 family)
LAPASPVSTSLPLPPVMFSIPRSVSSTMPLMLAVVSALSRRVTTTGRVRSA